ncbi:uncharacterized protein METZ01_LOCUS363730, partial [marine metagenome]
LCRAPGHRKDGEPDAGRTSEVLRGRRHPVWPRRRDRRRAQRPVYPVQQV